MPADERGLVVKLPGNQIAGQVLVLVLLKHQLHWQMQALGKRSDRKMRAIALRRHFGGEKVVDVHRLVVEGEMTEVLRVKRGPLPARLGESGIVFVFSLLGMPDDENGRILWP